MTDRTRIGLVTYCDESEFEYEEIEEELEKAYDRVEEAYGKDNIFVSGLTTTGALEPAYENADERGWELWGIACEKAKEHEFYDGIDEENREFVGESWGDESEHFLDTIDVLVKVGGGDQAEKELEKAKRRGIPTLEDQL